MNSIKPIFRQRSHCPGCDFIGFDRAILDSYATPALRSYLSDYYEGRANVDSLSEHYPELGRCKSSKLVYQRGVRRANKSFADIDTVKTSRRLTLRLVRESPAVHTELPQSPNWPKIGPQVRGANGYPQTKCTIQCRKGRFPAN